MINPLTVPDAAVFCQSRAYGSRPRASDRQNPHFENHARRCTLLSLRVLCGRELRSEKAWRGRRREVPLNRGETRSAVDGVQRLVSAAAVASLAGASLDACRLCALVRAAPPFSGDRRPGARHRPRACAQGTAAARPPSDRRPHPRRRRTSARRPRPPLGPVSRSRRADPAGRCRGGPTGAAPRTPLADGAARRTAPGFAPTGSLRRLRGSLLSQLMPDSDPLAGSHRFMRGSGRRCRCPWSRTRSRSTAGCRRSRHGP